MLAAIDQSLSDNVAKKLGTASVAPLKAAPAEESWRLRTNVGLQVQHS